MWQKEYPPNFIEFNSDSISWLNRRLLFLRCWPTETILFLKFFICLASKFSHSLIQHPAIRLTDFVCEKIGSDRVTNVIHALSKIVITLLKSCIKVRTSARPIAHIMLVAARSKFGSVGSRIFGQLWHELARSTAINSFLNTIVIGCFSWFAGIGNFKVSFLPCCCSKVMSVSRKR